MTLGARFIIELVLLAEPVPALPAQAADIPLRVEFEAPLGCSSADAFYSGVRGRTLRVRRANNGERAHELRVRLTRAKGRVHGELSILWVSGAPTPKGLDTGARATRVVDGSSCDDVADALALTTALALDPDARLTPAENASGAGASSVLREPQSPPRTEATPRTQEAQKMLPTDGGAPSGPAHAPPPARSSASDARSARSAPSPASPSPAASGEEPSKGLRLALGAELLVASVASPGTSFGASVFARVTYPVRGLMSPSLGVSLFHVRDDAFESAERASIHLSGVALSACPLLVPLLSGVALSPCALALGGWLEAHAGETLENPTSAVRSWWSLGALVRGSAALGLGVALELQGGLTLPLVERRFAVRKADDTLETLSSTPALAPFVGFGVSFAP